MQSHNDFRSLDRVSSGVQYAQMLIARISALFLMLSLVTATWNLLIKDQLFLHLPWLEWIWGLAQAVAVDSALAVVFVRMAECVQNKQWARSVVYGVVGLLLLFVAWAIVDVESLRQALDITLVAAAGRLPFHLSIDFITQVRSIVVVLLIAVSGFEFILKPAVQAVQQISSATPSADPTSQPTSTEPEPANNTKDQAVKSSTRKSSSNGHSTDNGTKLAEFYALRPTATISETIAATGLSQSTISRWRKDNGRNQLAKLTIGVGEPTN